MTIVLLILGVILFLGLVIVHEWGHFTMARRNGVDIEEFGIGFPPKLWGKAMKSGYEFTINALPLGGFVRLKGENDSDDREGSFGAASIGTKSKIMLAGVGMNFIVAIILFTLVALIGMPQLITSQTLGEKQYYVARDSKLVKDIENKGVVKVTEVIRDTPASSIGLANEDEIVSINTQAIDTPEQLLEATKANAGKQITVVYKHNNTLVTKSVTLNSSSPYLGIAGPFADEKGFAVRRSTWSAPIVGAGVAVQISRLTFVGLGQALKGLGAIIAGLATNNQTARQAGQSEATKQVSGPLGIVFVLKAGAEQGIGFVLFIIAIISLSLAIMNLLPIPALDGGRFYMLLYSRLVLKRPLSRKTEERIVGTSFALLMVLFLLITVVDIKRFF